MLTRVALVKTGRKLQGELYICIVSPKGDGVDAAIVLHMYSITFNLFVIDINIYLWRVTAQYIFISRLGRFDKWM